MVLNRYPRDPCPSRPTPHQLTSYLSRRRLLPAHAVLLLRTPLSWSWTIIVTNAPFNPPNLVIENYLSLFILPPHVCEAKEVFAFALLHGSVLCNLPCLFNKARHVEVQLLVSRQINSTDLQVVDVNFDSSSFAEIANVLFKLRKLLLGDIVEVVEGYTTLRKSGSNFSGKCPIHNDKTPSMVVYPDNQSWHCFGCNKGGDVIRFIQSVEGTDFKGAIAILGSR